MSDYQVCQWCKKRFTGDRWYRSPDDCFCSKSCLYAYKDQQQQHNQDIYAQEKSAEAIKEAAYINRRIAEQQMEEERTNAELRARAERDRAAAEREKAAAINEQTAYLKKKEKQDATLSQVKDDCKVVFESNGKRNRNAYRPFVEYDIVINSVYAQTNATVTEHHESGQDCISVSIGKIINKTPNGTGNLKLQVCLGNNLGSLVRTYTNESTGEDYYQNPDNCTGAACFETNLPPLEKGENIIDKTFSLSPVGDVSSSHLKSSMDTITTVYELIDGEWKALYRTRKNLFYDNFAVHCPHLRSSTYGCLSVKKAFCSQANRTKPFIEKAVTGIDGDTDTEVTIKNPRDWPTANLYIMMAFADRNNPDTYDPCELEEVTIGTLKAPKFIWPNDSVTYDFVNTPSHTHYNYIPYVYLYEYQDISLNQSELKLLDRRCIGQRGYCLDTKKYSKYSIKTKLTEGYVLNDENGYLFLLPDDSNDRIYFMKNGSKIRKYPQEITFDGNYGFQEGYYGIPSKYVVKEANGTKHPSADFPKFFETVDAKYSQDVVSLNNGLFGAKSTDCKVSVVKFDCKKFPEIKVSFKLEQKSTIGSIKAEMVYLSYDNKKSETVKTYTWENPSSSSKVWTYSFTFNFTSITHHEYIPVLRIYEMAPDGAWKRIYDCYQANSISYVLRSSFRKKRRLGTKYPDDSGWILTDEKGQLFVLDKKTGTQINCWESKNNKWVRQPCNHGWIEQFVPGCWVTPTCDNTHNSLVYEGNIHSKEGLNKYIQAYPEDFNIKTLVSWLNGVKRFFSKELLKNFVVAFVLTWGSFWLGHFSLLLPFSVLAVYCFAKGGIILKLVSFGAFARLCEYDSGFTWLFSLYYAIYGKGIVEEIGKSIIPDGKRTYALIGLSLCTGICRLLHLHSDKITFLAYSLSCISMLFIVWYNNMVRENKKKKTFKQFLTSIPKAIPKLLLSAEILLCCTPLLQMTIDYIQDKNIVTNVITFIKDFFLKLF